MAHEIESLKEIPVTDRQGTTDGAFDSLEFRLRLYCQFAPQGPGLLSRIPKVVALVSEDMPDIAPEPI
jgi:hypothetical protein